MSVVFRSVLALSSVLSCFGGSVPAFAADEDASPTLVVTAQRDADPEISGTKTATPLRDTPQSVVILSRQRLDDRGAQTLNDSLRYVPGVTLGQGEGHRDQIVLRGQPSTADFFVDGLRDDAQYYRPLFNTERVEVLKGANALLFGRGGGGGVVNRSSKQARPGNVALAGAASLDRFGAWSAAADLNLPTGEKGALRLNAAYESLDNDRDAFGGHFIGVAPTLSWQASAGTRLTLAYEYDHDDRVIDRGLPALGDRPMVGVERTFFGSRLVNRGTVDAHIARARLDQSLGEALTLDISAQYAFYDKHYANILPDLAKAGAVRFSGYDSTNQRSNLIAQTNVVWRGTTGSIGHTVLVGGEVSQQDSDATRRNALFASTGGAATATLTVPLSSSFSFPAISWTTLVSDSKTTVETGSFYVQDQIALTPWLQIVGGLRYDRFAIAANNRIAWTKSERTDAKWSPRAGLVLKPAAQVSLYASYAESFLPQSGDQFATLDPSLQSLEPEAFMNREVGAKWDVKPGLTLTFAAFQLDRNNTRVADPVHPGLWLLTGRSRTRGLELALDGRVTPIWQISLGYTVQQGEIRSATAAAPAGRQLDKLPHHQAVAWTRYDLSHRFALGLGVVHQSGQYATISNAVWLPAFTRLDAAAYLDLSDSLTVQLNIENLTGSRYFASAHTDNNIQPGAPLNAKLTARIKY